jgi:hypothetical protein
MTDKTNQLLGRYHYRQSLRRNEAVLGEILHADVRDPAVAKDTLIIAPLPMEQLQQLHDEYMPILAAYREGRERYAQEHPWPEETAEETAWREQKIAQAAASPENEDAIWEEISARRASLSAREHEWYTAYEQHGESACDRARMEEIHSTIQKGRTEVYQACAANLLTGLVLAGAELGRRTWEYNSALINAYLLEQMPHFPAREEEARAIFFSEMLIAAVKGIYDIAQVAEKANHLMHATINEIADLSLNIDLPLASPSFSGTVEKGRVLSMSQFIERLVMKAADDGAYSMELNVEMDGLLASKHKIERYTKLAYAMMPSDDLARRSFSPVQYTTSFPAWAADSMARNLQKLEQHFAGHIIPVQLAAEGPQAVQ